MGNLSIYKKIQIILLILIIIALAIFIVLKNNRRKVDKSLVEPVSSQLEDVVEKIENEEMIVEMEEVEEKEGDISWDEQNVEDSEVDMSDENEKNNSSRYYIKINYTANCVTIYTKDSLGKYTIPVKAMVCSTGTATPTTGVYKTSNKYRWHLLNGGVYGQYCTRITGHILFHSVPYSTNSNDSLKYAAYDKLGTKASAGCIRLTVEDAMWIYSNCASGTLVEFYSASTPGPLGKPSAKKISSNVQCRNWDPTDPDSRNPWHTYKEPVNTQPSIQTQPVPSNPAQPEIPNNSEVQSSEEGQKDDVVQNNTNDNKVENTEPSKDNNINENNDKNETSGKNTTVNESKNENSSTNESENIIPEGNNTENNSQNNVNEQNKNIV